MPGGPGSGSARTPPRLCTTVRTRGRLGVAAHCGPRLTGESPEVRPNRSRLLCESALTTLGALPGHQGAGGHPVAEAPRRPSANYGEPRGRHPALPRPRPADPGPGGRPAGPHDPAGEGRADDAVGRAGGPGRPRAAQARRLDPAHLPGTGAARPRADRPHAPAHPAAGRRGLHPRPLLPRGRDDLPHPAGHGRHLGRRPGRARRAGHRRRGRRHRRALDVLPGAVHRARPALGPGGRDLRRGPGADRRAGLRDGPRLPGRRAGRPHRRPGHGQALRRLLRDPGRPGRQRGRPVPAQAALVVPAAVRAGRPRGLPDVHARLPDHRRRADHGQLLAARRGAARRVGLHRHAGHRLGQRRPHGLGAARAARLRPRRRGGRPGGQRHDHDHARVLRGRPGGRRVGPARRGRAGPRRGPDPVVEVRAGPVRGPPPPRRRPAARRDQPPRPRRAQPGGGPALPGAAAQRRHPPADRGAGPPDRGRRTAGRRRPDPVGRLGGFVRAGRLAARRPAPRDDHHGARRPARPRAARLGGRARPGRRHPHPGAGPRGRHLPRRPAAPAGGRAQPAGRGADRRGGRRRPGRRLRRRRRGRPRRVGGRGVLHRHPRPGRRPDRPARRPGRHRDAAGRGPARLQAAGAARVDPRRRAAVGGQPRHAGRAGRRRGAARPGRAQRQAADLLRPPRRAAAHVLQPGARPARHPVRRPDPGPGVRLRGGAVLHPGRVRRPAPGGRRARAGGSRAGRRHAAQHRHAAGSGDGAGVRQRHGYLGQLGGQGAEGVPAGRAGAGGDRHRAPGHPRRRLHHRRRARPSGGRAG